MTHFSIETGDLAFEKDYGFLFAENMNERH